MPNPVGRAKFNLRNVMESTQLQISGMTCGGCVAHVTKALSAVPGVRSIRVDLQTGRADIEHEGAVIGQMIAAVREEDYEAQAL
jgi:copper chaperone CopZ